MKIFILIITLILSYGHSFAHKLTVDSIVFVGLTKTNESYLRKIIYTKEGQQYDSIQVSNDVKLLKNLNLFFDVQSTVKHSETALKISFLIKEAIYTYPIFELSGFKDQLKLSAGVNFINFLGRAQNCGIIYQFYDRHSLTFFHSQRRHSNRKTGHEFSLSRKATKEPLYDQDTVSFFNFDNNSISLGGHYWFNNNLRIGVGGQYMQERYEQLDDNFYLPQSVFHFQKYQIRSNFEFNTIQNTFEFIEGTKANLYLESIITNRHPEATFAKITGQINQYFLLGKRGNLAGKLSVGLASNNTSPFSPFVLDGILNVRGIGNRIERGTAEIITNLEYRNSFISRKTFSVQAVAFTDFGSTRMPGKNLNTLFDREQHYLFTGLGVRFHLKKWFKTCVRIDYSLNTFNINQNGFTFGIGQFF